MLYIICIEPVWLLKEQAQDSICETRAVPSLISSFDYVKSLLLYDTSSLVLN